MAVETQTQVPCQISEEEITRERGSSKVQTEADESVAAISRRAVAEFLRRTGLHTPATTIIAENTVSQRVHATISQWSFGNIAAARVTRHTVTGVSMATTTYAHNHPDTQVHIALYTVLGLCVDDLEVDTAALSEFVGRLQAGLPQLHPVLEHLAHNLRAMPDFFHPYAASVILAGTIHAVNCALFEKGTGAIPLHPSALSYVRYKRARNGAGEVYASFIWDKFNFPDISTYIQVTPEAMTFLDFSNDILSFYKEEIAGEQHNFVHDSAFVTGKHVHAVLLESLDELVGAVERARRILQGEKQKQTWERFLAGWVTFHFLSPRYKLAQLIASN